MYAQLAAINEFQLLVPVRCRKFNEYNLKQHLLALATD